MRLGDVTVESVAAMAARIEDEVPGLDTLEAAAQWLANLLYESFEDSVALARVFATVPYAQLPLTNARFVANLARDKGVDAVGPGVPVLSLLGTRGVHADWNNRHSSRGHVGIPLVSAEFIGAIPMIATLVQQLGVGLQDISGVDRGVVTQSLGGAVGAVFHVEDARTGLDGQGRKIISAQDFVEEFGIRTVFGFGGAYTSRGTLVVAVVFSREQVPRRQVERLLPLVNVFKAVTLKPAMRGRVFQQDHP